MNRSREAGLLAVAVVATGAVLCLMPWPTLGPEVRFEAVSNRPDGPPGVVRPAPVEPEDRPTEVRDVSPPSEDVRALVATLDDFQQECGVEMLYTECTETECVIRSDMPDNSVDQALWMARNARPLVREFTYEHLGIQASMPCGRTIYELLDQLTDHRIGGVAPQGRDRCAVIGTGAALGPEEQLAAVERAARICDAQEGGTRWTATFEAGEYWLQE